MLKEGTTAPEFEGTLDDGSTFTLCIDEDFAGCNQDGRGERLFDVDGEQTQYLGGVLAFLKDSQAHFMRTQAFCKKLKELDLLEPMRAQFTLKSGQQFGLEGFLALSREKLKALPGDKLAELARTDELELMYLHLHSMRNFSAMIERVAPGAVMEKAAGAKVNGDEAPEIAAPTKAKKSGGKKKAEAAN